MEDDDIFMKDHEVFVSLGLRADDEAARMNSGRDGGGLNAFEAKISVNDYAENEPRFTIDKESPKIKKAETFPSMVDFIMTFKAICNSK